ncbi:MAG TPA: DUF1569 domain-containing protein [Flavisolibacter sp.]|nr:DUF1569 domain-containing protein [Flavisolibacter sp.]
MKSVFDQETRQELVRRINSLHAGSTAQWGKMNICQMLTHCVLCEEMYLGKATYKRSFIGRIFGRIGLKNILKDEKPLQRNSPTSPAFKVTGPGGDVAREKRKWISLIEQYADFSNDDFEHWFFGKMTREQVGWFVYKHSDHHLRQFNA